MDNEIEALGHFKRIVGICKSRETWPKTMENKIMYLTSGSQGKENGNYSAIGDCVETTTKILCIHSLLTIGQLIFL